MFLPFDKTAAATCTLSAVAEAATGALSVAERSYLTSEVWGRSREDPLPEGQWPRGVTPRPRSGAAAEGARLRRLRNSREELPKSEVRGGSREELPQVRGQGQRLRGDTPQTRSGAAAGRSYPTPQARGSGRDPYPMSKSCTGAAGPRRAIPRWRSGRALVRRYPSSKVRSSSCTLMERPWRDTACPR